MGYITKYVIHVFHECNTIATKTRVVMATIFIPHYMLTSINLHANLKRIHIGIEASLSYKPLN